MCNPSLESFLHPIAAELNGLAAGVSGVTVAGNEEPELVRAFVIQLTTDMPAGDKLLNCKTSGLSRHVEPYFHHFITIKRHFPRGTLPS